MLDECSESGNVLSSPEPGKQNSSVNRLSILCLQYLLRVASVYEYIYLVYT